jgi:hypothetical protein
VAVWILTIVVAGLALALGALVSQVKRLGDRLGRPEDARRARALQLLAMLAPGVAAAGDDPTAILAWQPVAATARSLFPDEFASLDRAAGGSFPFDAGRIQHAHSTWTAGWLAWEQAHEAAFRLKVAEAQSELAAAGTALARARLEAVEREKLALYQTRYAQYIRVAKALQALMPDS